MENNDEINIIIKRLEQIDNNLKGDKIAANASKDALITFVNYMSALTSKELKEKLDPISDACTSLTKELNKILNFTKKTQKIDENNEDELEDSITIIEDVLLKLKIYNGLEFQGKNYKTFKLLKEDKKKMEKNLIKDFPKNKDLISKFNNKEAANMWLTNFKDEEVVDWKTFETGLENYFKNTNLNVKLDPQTKRNLRAILDEYNDQKITWMQCDTFFSRVWDNKMLRENVLLNSLNMEVVDPGAKINQTLLLKFITYMGNDASSVKHRFPIGTEIRITTNETIYKDSQNPHTIKKTLTSETLIFGRFSPIVHKQPDIVFDESMKTIGKKQFNILCKNFSNDLGYYITDLSRLNKTNFFVKDKPYKLNKGMVIELNCTFFHIKDLQPLPFEDSNTGNGFFVDTIEYKRDANYAVDDAIKNLSKQIDEDDDEDNTRRVKKNNAGNKVAVKSSLKAGASGDDDGEDITMKKKKLVKKPVEQVVANPPELKKGLKPYVTIVPFDDDDQGREYDYSKTFTVDDDEKRRIFKIGTHPSSDLRLGPNYFPPQAEANQFNEYHCQVVWDGRQWIIQEKAIPEQKEFSIGTHVCLKNYAKFTKGEISDPFKLYSDMEISSAHHIFSVKLL